MTVLVRPTGTYFACDVPDYVIDTDSTISFEVKLKDQVILSEEYSPDASNQVRIRKLGRFLAKSLWGIWASATVTVQNSLSGMFTFFINGVQDSQCTVVYARQFNKYGVRSSVPISTVINKVINTSAPDYTSFYVKPDEVITLKCNGNSYLFYTHSGDAGVVTLDTDYSRIKYFVGTDFTHCSIGLMDFTVDNNKYLSSFWFRFKNSFDCQEIVVANGGLTQKGSDSSESAFMFGVERNFIVNRSDEYTARSGVIFLQSSYKLWADFVNAQEASMFTEYGWMDIIITSKNFERDFRKNRFSSVEFTFHFADPDNNGVL